MDAYHIIGGQRGLSVGRRRPQRVLLRQHLRRVAVAAGHDGDGDLADDGDGGDGPGAGRLEVGAVRQGGVGAVTEER